MRVFTSCLCVCLHSQRLKQVTNFFMKFGMNIMTPESAALLYF